VVAAGVKLPQITDLNIAIGIEWSGRFVLDGVFGRIAGKSFVVLICSDLVSLDIVYYSIHDYENYASWKNFCQQLKIVLSQCDYNPQFFISDGKKGLHQALQEDFATTPRQLCVAHKLRRIYQIIPHIRGNAIDKMIARFAVNAILAPDEKEYRFYQRTLEQFKKPFFFDNFSEPHQNKLKKTIGALRYQQRQLFTRYRQPDLVGEDRTTNSHEGSINGFLKERMKLARGFKSPNNLDHLIKLLIYYYRFHPFVASKYSERNGQRPIELNIVNRNDILNNITKGDKPWSWIKNLISSP